MRRTLRLALLLAGAATTAQAQSMVIRGGPIYTGVDGAPPAGQVVVTDGRITYVGPARDMVASDQTVWIDLKGAALFPGFTDGHAHLDGIGWRELTLNLEGSASVAEAMAKGALKASGAGLAASVTGIAGPTGGTAEKPVGLVHFAVAHHDGRLIHHEARFGDIGRDRVRLESVRTALRMMAETLA